MFVSEGLTPFLAAFAAILTGVFLVIYLYGSYCFVRIGRKLNVDKAWMAWVPIAQIFYMVKCAGRSYGWVFLAFASMIITPMAFVASFSLGYMVAAVLSFIAMVATVAFYVLIWVDILSRLNISKWLLILLLLPVVNLFVLGYIAFSKPRDGMNQGGGSANPQLVDYINSQLNAGADRETIKQSLLSAGWQGEDIEQGFDAIFSPAQSSAQSHNLFAAIVVIVISALMGIPMIFAFKSASQFGFGGLNFNNVPNSQLVVPTFMPIVSATPTVTPTPVQSKATTPKPKSPIDYNTYISSLVAQGWKKATLKPAPDQYGSSFTFYYPSNFKGQNTNPASPRDSIDTIDNPVSGEINGMSYTSYDSVVGVDSESSSAYSQETAFDAEIKFVTKFAEGSPVITDFVTASGLSGKKVVVTTSSFGKLTQSEYIILHTGRNSSYGDEIAIRVDVSMNYVDIAEKIAKSINLN